MLFIASVYLISLTVRIWFPAPEKKHLKEKSDLIVYEGKEVEFRFLDYGHDAKHPLVVIIPGPFEGLKTVQPLASRLSDRYRVVIPRFPTHSSDNNLLSHSSRTRAEMLDTWLNHQNSETFHLAGHGFGNSVAIEYIGLDGSIPLKSYAMISALGVQEFHFLGYHALNQPVYSLLYPVGFAVDYLLPLANWNEQSIIDMERVRIMNAMDQRAYRSILKSINEPVLILHGNDDKHVLPETAMEHHRIIPQSDLIIFEDESRSMADNIESRARAYSDFLQRTENGETRHKTDALPDRLAAAEKDFKFGDVPPVHGWGLVIILVLLSFVTLVSEDLGCIGGGLLVAGGVTPLWIIFLTIYIGITIADTGIYWIGRKLGRPVITKRPFRWFISKRDVDMSSEMFRANGFKIVFLSRFLPGSRFPTYFAAGILKTNFTLFLLYFLLAITIWTPLLLWISIVAGDQMLEYLQIYQEYALQIFIGLVVGLYLVFKYLLPLATKKGRREFTVRMIRIKQRLFN